jgi:8-oxo-dGTP diphosphatase
MSKLIAVDVFGKQHEVSVEQLVWRPSVYGVVIKENKVLLSPQFGDKYDLPGGGVDLGENLEAAVVREVKEETGIDVKVTGSLGVESNLFAAVHGDGKFYHSIMVYYACEVVGGELSTEGFDDYEKKYADLAKWVPTDTLASINLGSSVDFRKYIYKAQKGVS